MKKPLKSQSITSLLLVLFVTAVLGVSICISTNAQIKTKSDLDCSSHRESQLSLRDVEVRFGLYPRFREEVLDDLFLTVQEDGKVYALMYDYDSSTITAAHAGSLSKDETQQIIARVQQAFRQVDRSSRSDDSVIVEGDLFYLSIKRSDNSVKEIGMKVGDASGFVRKLVTDLSELQKHLPETVSAAGYVRSFPIQEKRLEVLRRRTDTGFKRLEDYPYTVRQSLIEATKHPQTFQSLSQSQLDVLHSQPAMVVTGGITYELYLYTPRRSN